MRGIWWSVVELLVVLMCGVVGTSCSEIWCGAVVWC